MAARLSLRARHGLRIRPLRLSEPVDGVPRPTWLGVPEPQLVSLHRRQGLHLGRVRLQWRAPAQAVPSDAAVSAHLFGRVEEPIYPEPAPRPGPTAEAPGQSGCTP